MRSILILILVCAVVRYGIVTPSPNPPSTHSQTAPFKLTEEMVEVMGGLESKLFGEFVKAFTTGTCNISLYCFPFIVGLPLNFVRCFE